MRFTYSAEEAFSLVKRDMEGRGLLIGDTQALMGVKSMGALRPDGKVDVELEFFGVEVECGLQPRGDVTEADPT